MSHFKVQAFPGLLDAPSQPIGPGAPTASNSLTEIEGGRLFRLQLTSRQEISDAGVDSDTTPAALENAGYVAALFPGSNLPDANPAPETNRISDDGADLGELLSLPRATATRTPRVAGHSADPTTGLTVPYPDANGAVVRAEGAAAESAGEPVIDPANDPHQLAARSAATSALEDAFPSPGALKSDLGQSPKSVLPGDAAWSAAPQVHQETLAADAVRTASSASGLAAPADATAIRDQIVAAIATRGQDTKIEIALDPPELGRVSIDFDGDSERLIRVVIAADAPATADLLRRHLELFEQLLARSGMPSIQVELRDRDAANSGYGAQSEQKYVHGEVVDGDPDDATVHRYLSANRLDRLL